MASLTETKEPTPTPSNTTTTTTTITPFLDFFDKVLFRSTTANDATNPEIYQITINRSPSAISSATNTTTTTTATISTTSTTNQPSELLTFQIFRFYTDESDQDTSSTPLCGGKVQINTISMGSQTMTTAMLSGDLSTIGMSGEHSCGTVDMEKEQIIWSNKTVWEVHARDAEDTMESFVGLNVENLDMLTPVQMKLQMLFNEFDQNEDGVLDYDEFMALDAATEEDPQQMSKEDFLQIVSIVHSVREETSTRSNTELDLLDLTCIYVGPIAEMFQTDLNSDFSAVFPEEAKVAFIFDFFDQDEDGFWSPEEEAEYVAKTGRGNVSLEWYRSEDGTTFVSISSLMPIYLVDGSVSDDLEVDFQAVGKLAGFMD
jgi:hypothetical protein